MFRPGGARQAFPCFDEPHLRAPFRISVFRDRFHIGLSNSIVHATDDVGFYMGTGLVCIHEKNDIKEKWHSTMALQLARFFMKFNRNYDKTCTVYFCQLVVYLCIK